MKVTTAIMTAAAALMLTAGASVAAPSKYSGPGYGYGAGKHGPSKHWNGRGGNAYERAAIARSAANLASLKRRAWADGRISFRERVMIQNAERRHAALVQRARRS